MLGQHLGRRQFLRYGSLVGAVGVSLGGTPLVMAGENLDDRGHPIEQTVTIQSTSSRNLPINPSVLPDGTIKSTAYDWLRPGDTETEGEHTLSLADRGGVDINYRFRTEESLTIQCHWRCRSGSNLAYLFNDADSESVGFRAFTNGIAGNGLYFRNVFGGRDIAYRENIQDGRWHRIRVVLDAKERTYSAYVDEQLVGVSSYHGLGWTSRDQFRVMGRVSGSSTQVEYDRFVITPNAVHQAITQEVTSPLLQYDIEAGSGNVLLNGASTEDKILREQAANKLELIDTIRTRASGLLMEDTVAQLDTNAEQLVQEITGAATTTNADIQAQYRETVSRLLAAESVTLTAVDAGLQPAREIANSVVDFAVIILVGRIAKRFLAGGSWLARQLGAQVSSAVRIARQTYDDLVGRQLLPRALQRELDEVFATLRQGVEKLYRKYGSEIESNGEELLSTGVAEGVKQLPQAFVDGLREIKTQAEALFALIFYTGFCFQEEKLNDEGRRIRPPGVNPAIQSHVQHLSSRLDSDAIFPGDETERNAIASETSTSIQKDKQFFLNATEIVRTLEGGAGLLAVASAFVALIAYAVSFATSVTGIGLIVGAKAALIGATITVYAGIFAAASVALTGSVVLGGRKILDGFAEQHDNSTKQMLTPNTGGIQ